MSEFKRISKADASREGLTSRLHLVINKKGDKIEFIGDVEHPRGGTVIMEAYKIIEEDKTRYVLKEITPSERERLIHKYEKGSGNGFSHNGYKDQRI